MTSSELVMKRYSEAYNAPGSMTRLGNLLVAAGVVLGSAVFISGLVAGSEVGFAFLFALWILAGFIAVLGCGVGKIVVAQGNILRAALDNAVNTSPFLSDADRLDLMSVTAEQPSSLVGIGSLSPAEPIEYRKFESPVAALISSAPSPGRARNVARRRNNAIPATKNTKRHEEE